MIFQLISYNIFYKIFYLLFLFKNIKQLIILNKMNSNFTSEFESSQNVLSNKIEYSSHSNQINSKMYSSNEKFGSHENVENYNPLIPNNIEKDSSSKTTDNDTDGIDSNDLIAIIKLHNEKKNKNNK